MVLVSGALAPPLAAATPNAAGSAASQATIDNIMPPLADPPAALQVKPYNPASAVAQAGYSEAAMPSVTPEFQAFREQAAKTSYDALVQSGAPLKATRAQFLRMQAYVDNAYRGVSVLKTIAVEGRLFDCIPLRQQPSLRRGEVLDSAPDAGTPAVAGSATCDAGTVPFARLDAGDMAAFPSLEAFLSKGKAPRPATAATLSAPGGATASHAISAPESNESKHYYAHVSQNHWSKFDGGGAELSIWNPHVDPQDDAARMSLMQIWLAGKNKAGETETLEVGWQTMPAAWGTPLPGVFVYWTGTGYQQDLPNSGCYNLECAGFVQTSKAVVFAAPFARDRYSVAGGRQPTLQVAWQRNAASGNWWLQVDGAWIGYIPGTEYDGDLSKADGDRQLDAGGEIAAPDNLPSLPMGSGQFAEAGYRQAAFVTHMHVVDASGAERPVDLTSPSIWLAATPHCYTLALAGIAADALRARLPEGVSASAQLAPGMQGTSFYLGGPGTADAACSQAYGLAPANAAALANGVALAGLAGASGSSALYKLVVPAGARGLNVRTFGGSGEVLLYVKAGNAPAGDSHDDFTSTRPGSTQSIVAPHPLATTYYVLLKGASNYSGVNLQASYSL